IDRAIAVGSISTLWVWVVILLGIFIVNAAAGGFGRALFQRAGLEIGHVLRMTVTDRISHPRGMAGKQRTAGELLAIASAGKQRVAGAVIMTVLPFAEGPSIIYVDVVGSGVNLPLALGVL